jgi:hypothetical protein
MRLTERDHGMLKCFDLHRFLRSDHITSLLPGSRQQTLRRLQRLYHHGYLDRPRCQIDYYHRGGSRSIAYGLGNKGAGWLKRELSLPFHQLDWPKKNRVARLFLEHALLISDVMVAVELACRKHNNAQLLMPDDIQRDPFRWTVKINSRQTCGVIPDRVFGLKFTDKAGRKQQVWFFLEADCGTMPIRRSNPEQSSFYRKLLAYEATWTQNIHGTKLGIHRFRVLTVTSGAERLNALREACRTLKRGHGLFLFTDATILHEQSDFFALRWQTCREGETAGLLD